MVSSRMIRGILLTSLVSAFVNVEAAQWLNGVQQVAQQADVHLPTSWLSRMQDAHSPQRGDHFCGFYSTTAALRAVSGRYHEDYEAAKRSYDSTYCLLPSKVGAFPSRLKEFGQACTNAHCGLIREQTPLAGTLLGRNKWHKFKKHITNHINDWNPVIALVQHGVYLHYIVAIGYNNNSIFYRDTNTYFYKTSWDDFRNRANVLYSDVGGILIGLRNYNAVVMYAGADHKLQAQRAVYEQLGVPIDVPVKIKSKVGRYLVIHRDRISIDGEQIELGDYYGENSQKWVIQLANDRSVHIKSLSSGKCVDVHGYNPKKKGAPIIQWSFHGGDNQKWHIQHAGEGWVRIHSVVSSHCLDVNVAQTGDANGNGAKAIQWSNHGGDNQKWLFERA